MMGEGLEWVIDELKLKGYVSGVSHNIIGQSLRKIDSLISSCDTHGVLTVYWDIVAEAEQILMDLGKRGLTNYANRLVAELRAFTHEVARELDSRCYCKK